MDFPCNLWFSYIPNLFCAKRGKQKTLIRAKRGEKFLEPYILYYFLYMGLPRLNSSKKPNVKKLTEPLAGKTQKSIKKLNLTKKKKSSAPWLEVGVS